MEIWKKKKKFDKLRIKQCSVLYFGAKMEHLRATFGKILIVAFYFSSKILKLGFLISVVKVFVN